MSIYNEMKQAGIEIDHHESDLYVPDCPTSRAILANHGKTVNGDNGMYGIKIEGWNVQRFISQIDNKQWLNIPFQYVPFWEGKS